MFVGTFDEDRQKNETDRRVLWVSVENTSVRFERPRVVDLIWPGPHVPRTVLCGGWLVRREDEGGRFESVVEGGFVVSGR